MTTYGPDGWDTSMVWDAAAEFLDPTTGTMRQIEATLAVPGDPSIGYFHRTPFPKGVTEWTQIASDGTRTPCYVYGTIGVTTNKDGDIASIEIRPKADS